MLALAVVLFVPASAADEARVREAASATYLHGMTIEIAEREAGRDAVPTLLRLLNDPEFERRDNVVAFLAYLGGAESTGPLRRFLETTPPRGTRAEDARARLLVPHALGRIAGRGEPAALDALLTWTDPLSRAPDSALLDAAVGALAYAGAPARERLVAIGSEKAQRALELMEEIGRAARTAEAPASTSPAVAFVADASTTSHRHGITFANHISLGNPMTTVRLDAVLGLATDRAARGDYDVDVACCVEVGRSGLAATFGSEGDGLETIDSSVELNTVLSFSSHRAKVVTAINYCGGPGTNIIGCATTPGSSMVLVRLSALGTEAVLWIHEYGHNIGLDHSGDSRELMYSSDNGNNSGLQAFQCQTFHAPSGSAQALFAATGACTDDGDSYADPIDNCPLVENESQADSDGNGIGDACEGCPDGDGDGVCTVDDNCPSVVNPSQADFDGDGIGDACEVAALLADTDHSGIVDGIDLAALGRAFGALSGEPRYDADVDLDRDGQVDGADLALLAASFGKAS